MKQKTEVTPIFLISLPRSGSTWVQRELCKHPGLMSSPETWAMLPLIYLNRVGHTFTPYSAFIYERARLVMKERGVLYHSIFSEAAHQAGMSILTEIAGDASWVMDKTPRYAHVAPELVDLFPQAKFVFLWRNPLDIGLSILRSWGEKWDTLFRYEIDFVDGLTGMLFAAKKLGAKAVHVDYDIIRNSPETTITNILTDIGIGPYDLPGRSDHEISKMLSSDQIGDQTYKVKKRVHNDITSGNRRSLSRIINTVPEDFWRRDGYDKIKTQMRLAELQTRIAPINDIISASAASLYRSNLYGMTRIFNKRRDNSLGRIRRMMD